MKKQKNDGIPAAELSSFCGQVAMILDAGIPLYDGMETLAGADRKSGYADLYQAASDQVTATGSLYEALQSDPRWPEYMVEMVGIGERSGRLDQVMRGLEAYYAREERMRASIVSAVTYPVVLGILLVVIVLILLWKVLPVFRRVLDSMGITLTQTGSAMMQVGTVLGWVVMILVGILILLVLLGLLLIRAGKKEKVLALIRRVFPPMGKLQKKLSASRVAGVLSMMISGGFPTGEALSMTARVLEDPEAAAQVDQIRHQLEEGKTFSEAITETDIFEELQNRMIALGSATGTEDQVLAQIAAQNEEEAESGISRMVSIIEPTLVAILAVIIGAVLLSVMLSMAGLLTSL